MVEEAFHGPGGRRWLSQIPYPSSPTLAAEGLAAVMAAAAVPAARSRLLADLLKTLETIPPYERLQLWSERHRKSPGPGPFDQPPRPEDRQEDLRTDIAFVLNDLDVHSYFALEFSTTATGSCQASDGAHRIGQQLRLDPLDPDSPPLWPLFDQYGFAARWWVTCSRELLFDVIEALHWAAARPRRRRERENGRRTFSDHARGPGRDLYRWRINEVLARHDERWQMAGDGPERGRLVEVTGDPRDDLVQRLMTPAAARESTERRLRRGIPRLDLLVVSRHREAHRPHSGAADCDSRADDVMVTGPGGPDAPTFRLHAWADESMIDDPGTPASYLMAAVVCDPAICDSVRARLRSLLRRRQQRLHWHDESDARRKLIVSVLADLDLAHLVVVGSPAARTKQERARRLCLQALLHRLDKLGVTSLTLETRGATGDRRDRETVAQLLGRQAMSRELRVRHGAPRTEAMLWTPDVVAGVARLAVRGGDVTHLRALGAVEEIWIDIT